MLYIIDNMLSYPENKVYVLECSDSRFSQTEVGRYIIHACNESIYEGPDQEAMIIAIAEHYYTNYSKPILSVAKYVERAIYNYITQHNGDWRTFVWWNGVPTTLKIRLVEECIKEIATDSTVIHLEFFKQYLKELINVPT